jgi:hypothetical protein
MPFPEQSKINTGVGFGCRVSPGGHISGCAMQYGTKAQLTSL